MSGTSYLAWYAVRCVFAVDRTSARGRTYEERITLWRAGSFDDAIARAETEALAYAGDDDTAAQWNYLGLAQCYQLPEEPGDRAEVFSLIRDSELESEEYVDAFFDTGTKRQRPLRDSAP